MPIHFRSTLCAVVAVLGLLATSAQALHEESPSAIRLTSADDHTHTPGQSWGNWFAFSSTQDLAGQGPLRAAGRQIFLFNLGFFDCAEGTLVRGSDLPCALDGLADGSGQLIGPDRVAQENIRCVVNALAPGP